MIKVTKATGAYAALVSVVSGTIVWYVCDARETLPKFSYRKYYRYGPILSVPAKQNEDDFLCELGPHSNESSLCECSFVLNTQVQLPTVGNILLLRIGGVLVSAVRQSPPTDDPAGGGQTAAVGPPGVGSPE